MVKYYTHSLDTIFMALADATRRAILGRLAEGECSVTELAKPFNMSLPAISKHIRTLESAGLLMRRKEGRMHRCRLAVKPMQEAGEWIENYREFWQGQFDALDKYLNQPKDNEAD